ncbi:ATP synthase F1 subunit delta [bacterium]|nr:ATP synthase F1 subunit delta [bacterium]
MHSGPLVGRYARALFEVAAEQSVLEQVRADAKLLGEVIAATPALIDVLSAPAMGIARKRELIKSAFSESISELSQRFLELLLVKRRIGILPDVIRMFDMLWQEQQHEVPVTVTTAAEADARMKETISHYLKARTEKNPVVTWEVDAALIGGMRVRWPDKIEDSSLRRKLLEMRQSLAAT